MKIIEIMVFYIQFITHFQTFEIEFKFINVPDCAYVDMSTWNKIQ